MLLYLNLSNDTILYLIFVIFLYYIFNGFIPIQRKKKYKNLCSL